MLAVWVEFSEVVLSTVINNTGLDPSIYLTNGTRLALGLVGVSIAPQSVVQAAQEAYFAETGEWPAIDGMPNEASATPDPDSGGDAGKTSKARISK